MHQEHALVNRDWTKRGAPDHIYLSTVFLTCSKARRDGIVQNKILSNKAMGIIATEVGQKAYIDRKGAVEPPYMAPSADPVDYSNVRIEIPPGTDL
jgi:hypothetical protein